jgi:cyclophilin family peptidyl-prolyl cis-trans isomerase
MCLLLSSVLVGCTKNKTGAESASGAATSTTEKPGAATTENPGGTAKTGVPEKPAATAATKEEPLSDQPIVELDTTMGKIRIELLPRKAPKTVANFLKYVRAGHYRGTVFHRVIKGFMIQGGGFDTSLTEKQTTPPVMNEADNGLTNDRGTVAMARTPDPNSASAQFFINVVDNAPLNHKDKTPRGWGYCVFGKVIAGMDVVDQIRAVPTGPKGPFGSDVPQADVVINAAKIVK